MSESIFGRILIATGVVGLGWLLWDNQGKVKTLLGVGGGDTATLQPGEVAPILDAKNLWGGVPFDPNGAVGNAIFGAMDKVGFKGSFDATLQIDEKGNVRINATQPTVQAALQAYFGSRMSQAIKASKRELPTGGLTVPWLEGVRNA